MNTMTTPDALAIALACDGDHDAYERSLSINPDDQFRSVLMITPDGEVAW